MTIPQLDLCALVAQTPKCILVMDDAGFRPSDGGLRLCCRLSDVHVGLFRAAFVDEAPLPDFETSLNI